MAEEASLDTTSKSGAIAWLQDQLKRLGQPVDVEVKEKEEKACREQEEKMKMVAEIRKQQEDLASKLAELTGDTSSQEQGQPEQEQLWQQLQEALTSKGDMDPQRAMLRALTTQANKTTGPGGVNRLNPDIMGKLTQDGLNLGNHQGMNEWLAQFNKEDEGESLLKFHSLETEGECRHSKQKSGMLDKSTMNIRRKQTWPQKNLGEDWAEEELDFKQLRFEHLVAGETRTIEMCTEPAQILGRLKLLRRVAYLKL